MASGVLPAAKLIRIDGGSGLTGLFSVSCRDVQYGRHGFHPNGPYLPRSTSGSRSRGLVNTAAVSSSSSCCYFYSCPSHFISSSSSSSSSSSPLCSRWRERQARVPTVVSRARDRASAFVCCRGLDGGMNVDRNVNKDVEKGGNFSTAGCRRQWRWCHPSRARSGGPAILPSEIQAGLAKGEGGGGGGGGGGRRRRGGRGRRVVAMAVMERFNMEKMMKVFEWMKKQPWYRPNARTYTSLIGFMGREGKIELGVRLFEDMLAANCEPDHYTYTALINCYGKSRMFAEALAVFEHMKESAPDCKPNTVTCNALVDALCKGGRYDEAESIFWDMRKGKGGLGPHCAPNTVTYNTIIRALCNEGQIKAAVAMLEEMKQGELGEEDCQPNVVTYNILVDACGKAGMHDKAQQLFADMKHRGFQPDQITYTALLDAYGKAGIHHQAERTFKEMQSAGCAMDVLAYTALIDAYGKSGFHDRAEDLFFKMQVAGIQPNKVTYLTMIDAYGKAGLHVKAEQMFKRMQDTGFEPTQLTYSSLINAYGKVGLYREAATIFCNMQSAGCQPNLITYAALLSACGRDPDWEKAMTVMDALLHSGQEIELALCSLIIGTPKWRDYDEVDEDEENEKEKDTGVWKRAEKMFSIVRGHSVMAKRSFFNALIDVLWFFKLRGRAKRVLAAAREIGAYPEDCCVFGDDLWILDLHKLSVGAALTLLMTWMAELQLALEWGAEVPNAVRVITGWGRHSRSGESAVKVAVEECVSELGLPFRVIRGNEGSFLTSGKALHEWLLSDKAASSLILQDEEIAMPQK